MIKGAPAVALGKKVGKLRYNSSLNFGKKALNAFNAGSSKQPLREGRVRFCKIEKCLARQRLQERPYDIGIAGADDMPG